jgi:POT family proton-dependent oligopeptide transporter
VLGQKHLAGQAEPPNPNALKTSWMAGISREWWIYIFGLVSVILVWQVLQTKVDFSFLGPIADGHEVTMTEVVAVVMGFGLFIWFFKFLFSGISMAERGRMIVLMTLIVISALFWGLYEQSYGTWVAFAERVMDRSTFGIEWTAGQTTSFGAIFVIAFSPIFAWLWPKLDKHGMNPSLPAKFGWALVFLGLAFGVLMAASRIPGSDGLVSIWWMILAYALMVVGEMMLSPIGLSAVTTLSVPRVVGLMMGAWFLFSAFGEMIAGRLGTWASIDPNPDGSFDKAKALGVYSDVFGDMMWIGVVAGLALLLISPLLNRLTRE